MRSAALDPTDLRHNTDPEVKANAAYSVTKSAESRRAIKVVSDFMFPDCSSLYEIGIAVSG
jgi:hypothetical protein